MKDMERRFLPIGGATLKVETREGKKVLTGLAAPFGKRSLDLGGFEEEIAPGAFANALKRSDPAALFNHDPSQLLGRASAGTLRLSETDDGLRYEVDLPDTATGNTVRVGVERQDIQGNSFAFRIKKDQWEERDNGSWLRTVLEVEELYDVGPVVYPAYPDTAVALRSLDAVKKRAPIARLERQQRSVRVDD